MIYFDTSALIKAFIEEQGSGFVKDAMRREKFVATARITYVEIYSGLNRKRRLRELTEKAYRIAEAEFEAGDIHSVGYDATTNTLYVQLREAGEPYVYEGVEAAVFARLLKSKHKRAFANRFVEGRYRRSEL